MYVGTLQLKLFIRESRSLKDKRQVIRSVMDRLRENFHVAVSEVGSRDQRQYAVLGVATVAENSYDVQRLLGQIQTLVRGHPIAELCDCQTWIDRVEDVYSPLPRGSEPADSVTT